MKDLIRIFLAILLPPLGVFFRVGFGRSFWLNVILTLFGYVPGLVHSIWVIARLANNEHNTNRLSAGAEPGRSVL